MGQCVISDIKRKVQDIGHGGKVIAWLKSCFLWILLWVSPSVFFLEGKILDLSEENKRLKNWLSEGSTLCPTLASKIDSLEKNLMSGVKAHLLIQRAYKMPMRLLSSIHIRKVS